MSNTDILGLYKVKVFNGDSRAPLAVTKVIAFSRREAYLSVYREMPQHNLWEAERLRDCLPGEMPGRLFEKNDKKRKP